MIRQDDDIRYESNQPLPLKRFIVVGKYLGVMSQQHVAAAESSFWLLLSAGVALCAAAKRETLIKMIGILDDR